MIKRFNEYINEGVRDKMTPKSEEDIRKNFSKMEPYERMRVAIKNDMLWLAEESIGEVDLNQRMGGGTTAGTYLITYCVEKGSVDIFKLLLDNGCKVDKYEWNWHLTRAIQENRTEMAKYLISQGAELNDSDSEDSYLEMAVDNDNMEMLKLVLDCGCENFDGNWLEQTVLGNNVSPELIKFLIEKVPEIKKLINDLYNEYKLGIERLKEYV